MRDLTGGGVYLNFAGLGEENDLLARAGYGETTSGSRRSSGATTRTTSSAATSTSHPDRCGPSGLVASGPSS